MNLLNAVSFLLVTLVAPVRGVGVGEACTSDECDSGVFCGTDLTCHNYGCMDFFKFGPEAYVGHDGTSTEEVICEPITPGNEGPYAVTYTCNAPILEGVFAAGQGYGMPFNWKCTATPTLGLVYECYDVDPDTDFSSFEAEIAAGTVDCATNPIYGYMVATSYTVLDSDGNLDANNAYHSFATQDFNSALVVQSSMFSLLVTDSSPAPTAMATDAPTPAPVSSASKIAVSGLAVLLALASLF